MFFTRFASGSPELKRQATGTWAGIAQLVEYELPKLGVAGSNPVARFDQQLGASIRVDGSGPQF